MKKIILASGSPRRIEMMKNNGFNPLILPSSVSENLPLHQGMGDTVMYLALKKALGSESDYFKLLRDGDEKATKFAAELNIAEGENPIIIAADTVVFKDEIMGKPEDFEDGMRMLKILRNDVHYVATGVALLEAGFSHAKVFYEVTEVHFKDYSDEELAEYLRTPEAYDKAGGYAIQGYFSKYIDHFVGDYDNVVGFPWKRIMEELEKF